ncbi:MAG TPA: hypothetical protein VFZ95_12770 [Steroidobacteraceae bacterium]
MIATNLSRPGRLAVPLLLACALAACKPAHDDRPAAPQTAEPAPVASAPVTEDRGRQEGEQPAAAAETDQSAFSHVDSGEAERAASKRGHESAGEQTPAGQPGSGG